LVVKEDRLMSKRLEQLMKKKEELNAQIQKLRAEEANQKRKQDTRRKILLGSLVMEMMERGDLDRGVMMRALDGFLVRSVDRSLFDLPVEDKKDGQENGKEDGENILVESKTKGEELEGGGEEE
jgi:large subunit ribosomal protein L7/L12